MKIPEGHQTLMPYFVVEDASGFFDFAGQCLRRRLTHPADRPDVLDGHCEMRIG